MSLLVRSSSLPRPFSLTGFDTKTKHSTLSPILSLDSPRGEKGGLVTGSIERKIETRDLSQWTISSRNDINKEFIDGNYKGMFILIYTAKITPSATGVGLGERRYGATWANSQFLQGIQMESTVTEALASTITESDLVDKYPYDLDEISDAGGVIVAAISSLDECEALKLITIPDSIYSYAGAEELLAISIKIDSDDLRNTIFSRMIGSFEKAANEIDRKRAIAVRVLADDKGNFADSYLVSRVVGEGQNVTLPFEYLDPLDAKDAIDYVERAMIATRVNGLFVGVPDGLSYEETKRFINYLPTTRNLKGESIPDMKTASPILEVVTRSGEVPWLAHFQALVSPDNIDEYISNLLALEFKQLLVDPASNAADAGSVPWIFSAQTAYYIRTVHDTNLNPNPKNIEDIGIQKLRVGTSSFDGPIPDDIFMPQLSGVFSESIVSNTVIGGDRLLSKIDMSTSVFTGPAIGYYYHHWNDKNPKREDTIPSYYWFPVIPEGSSEIEVAIIASKFFQDKSAIEVKMNEIKDGLPRITYLNSSGKSLEFDSLWGVPIHIAHTQDHEHFHDNARSQVDLILARYRSMRASLDEENNVYSIVDTRLKRRPFLIYPTTLSNIMRSTSPLERIFITQTKTDGASIYNTYISASFFDASAWKGIRETWHWNIRPGIDRMELYEPISGLYGRVEVKELTRILTEQKQDKEFNSLFRRIPGGGYILINVGTSVSNRALTKISPFFGGSGTNMVSVAAKYRDIIVSDSSSTQS